VTSATFMQNTNIQSSKPQSNRNLFTHLSTAGSDKKNTATSHTTGFQESLFSSSAWYALQYPEGYQS